MALIGFCTEQDIRNRNAIFEEEDQISTTVIEIQIEDAEGIVISALSGLISEDDLISAAGSKVLKYLTIYKSMELCLVYKHGHTREIDSTTDVDYWMKKYDDYLEKILSGEVIIETGGTDYSPTITPKVTSNVTQIYDQRGVDGFDPDFDSNENKY